MCIGIIEVNPNMPEDQRETENKDGKPGIQGTI